MRRIACVNQKGGVGKTTVCANLASALAAAGHTVLAIDLDPQGQLTASFGITQRHINGISEVLREQARLEQVCERIRPGLTLIPAGQTLTQLESTPMGKGKGKLLAKCLSSLGGQYDFVLMDCPPSSGFLVVNALAAADELLIPVTADYLGLAGIAHLMASIRKFEKLLGPYKHKWVVISRWQKRRLSNEVKTKLADYFGSQLVDIQIAERAALAEAPSHGKPIDQYQPSNPASKEFQQLAATLLETLA